jgi:hypothetical protein
MDGEVPSNHSSRRGSEDSLDNIPRVVCRYGRGCTHTDEGHKVGNVV